MFPLSKNRRSPLMEMAKDVVRARIRGEQERIATSNMLVCRVNQILGKPGSSPPLTQQEKDELIGLINRL